MVAAEGQMLERRQLGQRLHCAPASHPVVVQIQHLHMHSLGFQRSLGKLGHRRLTMHCTALQGLRL